ncbi:MAG: hypothetical protein ABL962_21275 [Fimbriimonadaceae bacterium]
MSTGRRAYNMLRGFVNTEWDRINGLDQEAAWRELEQMTGGKPGKATETTTITLKTPEEKQAYALCLDDWIRAGYGDHQGS